MFVKVSLKIHNMLLVVALLTTFISFTQTEDEVRVNADALFKNKEYVEATPLYLRLLSLQPRSYDYSYKYGTCLLFNSDSKQDAIRYLSYAVKSPAPIPEASFFLGKAYHLNYQFNDAISEYKNYIAKAGDKGAYFAESNRNIAMCENGKNLLTTLTDVIVRKRTEIKQDDFFRLYDLAEIGGSIITAVDFQTKNDKKYNHKPIVHLAPNMENVYFSSYGEGDNLDIYVARKLPGGKFGVPQKLNGAVNTPFDEDFPYMHPNGTELYFSSKGHNSMGGYDIFKAKFNADNNTFEDVINVDFSISSPDDDLLYVVDKDNKNAYFSSRRQSQDGKIVVYKVAVERIPIQLAIVKGTFASSVLPPGSKMTVEVVDKTNGKKIGVFKTLKESSYLITFPKGGKYQYKITVEGSNEVFTVDVDIPFLKELRPLKQKMDHELADSKERIRITNLFDEQVEDAQSIVSQVLKERANLNVNEDQYNTEELEGQAKLKAALAELRLDTRSPMEFGQLLERTHTELKQNSTGENKMEQASDAISRNLYSEIAVIDTEIKALVKEADASQSNRRKELVLTNAKELYQQREEKLEKIKQIQTEAAAIETTHSSTTANPEKLGEISRQYNQFLNEGKTTELVALLNQNKTYLNSVLSAPVQTSPSEELLKKQEAIVNEITRLQSIENGYVEEIKRLENEIESLTQQKDAAKDKYKQEFQDKTDAKNYELENAKSSLSKTRNLIPAAVQQRDEINKKLNIVNEIESYQGKPATKEELARAKTIVSDEKSKTLKSYIEASLAELSTQQTDDPKGVKTEATIEQYNTQSEEIYAHVGWSEYEKQERLLTLNDQKQRELTNYLQELENDPAVDEATKIQQKNTTQKLIRELQHDQQLLQEAITVSAKNEIEQLKTESIVQELFPDYESNKQGIKQNSTLSEQEQLQQLNTNDQELADKITAEIKQLKSQQATAQEQSLSTAKINLLDEYRSRLQTTIAERQRHITRLQHELNAAQELEKQVITVSQQTESAYSDQLRQFNQLNAATQTNERIEVLNNLSATLGAQQQQLQQLKAAAPSNQTIAKALASIETKIAEVSALLTTEKTAQTTSSESTTNTSLPDPKQQKSPTILIEELEQTYTGNINNDFNQVPETTFEIEQNIQRLNAYKNTIRQTLETAEKNASEEEKTAYRMAAEQEFTRIDKRIDVLQQQQQTIEQQNTAQTNNQTAITPSKTPTILIEELQQTYTGNINNDFNQVPETTSEIEQNIQRLNAYKNTILQTLETAEKNASEEEKTAYRMAAEQEFTRIDKRIDVLQQQQQIIEQQNTAQNNIGNSGNVPDQVIPSTQEQSITSKLTDNATSVKERKELTKELTLIKQAKATENIRKNEEKIQELTSYISTSGNTSGDPVSSAYTTKSEQLSVQIKSEKDPLKKEILVDELLNIREEQARQIDRVQTLNENIAVSSANPEARMYPEEVLKARRRQGIIEIEELTNIRSLLQQQLATASKKEKETFIQEINALNERETFIKREQVFLETQLQQYTPVGKTPSLSENTTALTYNEERTIAASEEYETYAKAIAEQQKYVAEHVKLEQELTNYQAQLEELRNREKTAGTSEKIQLSDQKSATIERIKNISVSLKELEVKINEAAQTASVHLPTDSIAGMKFQNLVARGINPIKKSLIATALIPISVHGIEFNPATSPLPELKKIPVEVKTPMGLIYRVQVGAFARPIPETHFKEFSPVSGEKIENSNITRYMAGYFNTASTVVDAREKIRQLGYSDAFVVAYCDGKRISFGEARQLEARHACIGKKAEEIQVEVARNIAQNLGLEDTSKTLKPVAEHTYNQAPGAAKAWAIEQFDGDQLFYTVQVGVFNRPVTRDLLFNLEPLYTLRLDNGQIRYSVGMYGDLMHAVNLQSEVRKKGIPDAFVVAYYRGNRISVSKARELINNGVIVYKGAPNPQPKIEVQPTNQDVTTVVPVFSSGTLRETNTRPESYVQFVTKKMYEQYPREELNRYNNKGNFYYDKNDKHIKSTFYSDAFMLPRIAAFSDEIDTVHYTKSDVLKSNDSRVTFLINATSIPGDFNDWLTKFPYRKAYAHSENGIEIHIFDIQLEEVEEMKIISELFGYPLTETQNKSEYERNNE